MNELLEQFLIEAPELVEQASADLLTLDRNPGDTVAIDSAFRAIHTLKGSVALFDFAPMGEMLHAAEGLLEDVRKQKTVASKEVVSSLLACIGACEKWLEIIGQTERLPQGATIEAERLTGAIQQGRQGVVQATQQPRAGWLDGLLEREAEKLQSVTSSVVVAARYTPDPESYFQGEDALARVRTVPHLLALHVEQRQAGKSVDYDPYACTLVISLISAAPIDDVRASFPPGLDVEIVEIAAQQLVAPDPPGATSAAVTSSRTLRVESSRVDRLADMVGELIVAKNEFAHLVARAAARDTQLARALSANQASINRLAGEMHRAVMGLRMIPLARTFRRFPRFVRELGDRLGKSLRLGIHGDDLEADKVVVDGLYDPLLHVLRNAVDHGIEDREQRERTGKSTDGLIVLEATRTGDEIAISLSDDGAGIDAEKVRQRAQQIGIRSVAELEAMSEADVLELVFAPGFTTSSTASEVSGRGVGMDAVQSAMQALGGRATIESSLGQGTTVRLVVPRAVVITTILVVRVAGERFGVPIDAIAETARIEKRRIRSIRSGAAFALRDRTIPLLHLSALLGLPGKPASGEQSNVLICPIGNELVALEIDAVAERVDVLVRPMTGLLAAVPGALGTAMLGDGSVLMVLNIREIVDDGSGEPRHDTPSGLVRAR